MMKIITTCFLVMTLTVGCTQTPVEPEKPVDPPEVEQPQKPEEQEKPKEETKFVKKIDESKDWVYVESEYTVDLTKIFDSIYGSDALVKEQEFYSEMSQDTLFF